MSDDDKPNLFAQAAGAACESIAAAYRKHADVLDQIVASLPEPKPRICTDALRTGAQVLRLHAELTIQSVPEVVAGIQQATVKDKG